MKKIERLFKNELARKILLFFNENPQCIDTAKGISVWVGCGADNAQKILNKLVKEGVLVNHKSMSMDAYSYTTQRDIIKKVERLIKKRNISYGGAISR